MRKPRHRNSNGKEREREYDKSARTKAAILSAAVREFSSYGLAGARVDRIAKAARVNNHALYYHFGNKDALFRVVLEQGYESFRANQQPRALDGMDPEEGVAKIVSDVFEFVQRSPEHMAMTIEVNRHRGVNLDAEGRKRVSTAAAPLLSDLELVVREGKARKRFARGTNAEHLYFTIFALCSFYFTNAYTVSAVVGRNLLEPAAIEKRKKEIRRFVLAALRP
jgi:TetR/AcrR family transcriptional regulator